MPLRLNNLVEFCRMVIGNPQTPTPTPPPLPKTKLQPKPQPSFLTSVAVTYQSLSWLFEDICLLKTISPNLPLKEKMLCNNWVAWNSLVWHITWLIKTGGAYHLGGSITFIFFDEWFAMSCLCFKFGRLQFRHFFFHIGDRPSSHKKILMHFSSFSTFYLNKKFPLFTTKGKKNEGGSFHF